MTEVLLFVNIGLLVIGSVTLTIAVFVLQKARSYVELAEERMERLSRGQERLFQLLLEGQKSRSEPVGEEVELQELRRLRESQRDELARQSGSSSSWPEGRPGEPGQNVGLLTEDPEPVEPQEDSGVSSVPESKGSDSVVRHAHPDDDVSLRRESAKRDGTQAGAPIKMFREHYHRYLENYEGYVKLAERLCQTRENGEVPPGSPAEREWEEKLRRLNDGIQRTTTRLDILEQYNPELASDDRVSHRAEIAQSYTELEKKLSA